MHVNVLDFKLPPLPLPAECIVSRTFAGLVLWCPKAGNVMPRTQSPLNQPANIFRHNDIRSLVRLAPHDACALTLILALTVVVVLVAGSQQKGMPAARIKKTRCGITDPGNLATIVDS